MSGQTGDGERAASFPAGFAPAPVSTQPVSACVTVRDYRKDWVGDDSDIASLDREISLVGIDMTAWTIAFLDAVDAVFTPELTAALARLNAASAASLAGRRRQLAEVIAPTLLPVLVVPGTTVEVAPARGQFREALLAGLGTAYAPAAGRSDPLRVCPAPPVINAERAVGASASVSIAEALSWSYVLTVTTPHVVQDELLLSVVLNPPPARPVASVPATSRAAAPRAVAASLFEALARALHEMPQIVPHLAAVTAAAGGEAAVARAALARMDGLIGDVVSTWPAWFARASQGTMPEGGPEAGPVATDGSVGWHYAIAFDSLPALRATRLPDHGGALPPWPMIRGYGTPVEDGRPAGRYAPSDSPAADAPLSLAWDGLSLPGVEETHVVASVRRNADLVPPDAPAGTLVDPAFVYRTAMVPGAASVGPMLDRSAQAFPVGVDAPNLTAAIEDLFAQLLAGPTVGGLAMRDVRIEVAASWRAVLGGADVPIDTGIPIVLVGALLALSPDACALAIPVAIFAAKLRDALRDWHAAAEPEDVGAAIGLAISLSAAGAERREPLVRLGRVEIAVLAGRAGWWG